MVLYNLDVLILFFINKTLANSLFDLIMPITHILPYIFWVLLTAFFFFNKKYRTLVLLMLIAIAVDFISVTVVKDLVDRERPYQVLDVRQLVSEEDNKSFPSNHVQLSFLLSAIIFRFHRKFGLILFLVSLFIAFGRIYLGVHYPSDVFGGAVIGILLAFAILKMKHKFIGRKILT